MDVVLIVCEQRWEYGISCIRRCWGKSVYSFYVGDSDVVNLLDCVGGQAIFGTVPNSCSLKTEFCVVDFVVGVLLKSIIAAVHPSDVGVSLHVYADGGVEGVCVIDGNTGVVNDDQVSVGSGAGVFDIVLSVDGVAVLSWNEAWVVVHLCIWVQYRHEDFTRVVGRNVDHGFYEESHLIGTASGWELVCLSA